MPKFIIDTLGSDNGFEEIVKGAIENAKKARDLSTGKQEKFIALDIGPMGKLLKPYGDFPFEDAVAVYAKTVKIGVKYGVDLIFIETMNDSLDTKAALLAAKENSDLPVFVSNAYGEDGKLMTGATPEAMVAMLEGLGVNAIGVNCSLGPKEMLKAVKRLTAAASIPVIVKPNAGLPRVENGKTVFDVNADDFVKAMRDIRSTGATILGGCCGTSPEYIEKLVADCNESVEVVREAPDSETGCISSNSKIVYTPEEAAIALDNKAPFFAFNGIHVSSDVLTP